MEIITITNLHVAWVLELFFILYTMFKFSMIGEYKDNNRNTLGEAIVTLIISFLVMLITKDILGW